MFLNPSTCASDAEVAYVIKGVLPRTLTVCQQRPNHFSGVGLPEPPVVGAGSQPGS